MAAENTMLARSRECHQMLRRLAGRAPDDLLTRSRGWLAEGDVASLAQAVAFWAVSASASLTEDEADLLSAVLAENGLDASPLAGVDRNEDDLFPYYEFAAEIPAGEHEASRVRPPGGATRPVATAEEAAVQAVSATPGAIGLWRTWRMPANRSPWPPPKRIFVLEVDGATDEIAATIAVQDRLATVHEADPQVEVYQVGSDLPVYTELCRAYGELLWAASADPGVQIAMVFDDVSPDDGPSFRPAHPLLEPGEASKVSAYMYAGTPLLSTMTRMDDIVAPSRGSAVPMDFRTDGTWIWSDASTYYVGTHQIEPDTRLLAHIRANDYAPPRVDGVAIFRALQVLQEPADDEAAETLGDPGQETAEDSAADAPHDSGIPYQEEEWAAIAATGLPAVPELEDEQAASAREPASGHDLRTTPPQLNLKPVAGRNSESGRRRR